MPRPGKLKEAIEMADMVHSLRCPGEVPVILGSVENFDISDSGEYDIWIQNGVIYYFISCPKGPHECLTQLLNLTINYALRNVIGKNVLIPEGLADSPIINFLGCHTSFTKQPDMSIRFDKDYNQSQIYPVFVMEVASKHEDFHLLFCEAASWLSANTDVNYVLLVKIWPESHPKRVDIILLGRNGRRQSARIALGKGRLEPEAKKRYCVPTQKANFFNSTSDVESYYSVRIIQRFTIEAEPSAQDQIVIELDLHELLRNSNFNVGSLSTPIIRIDITEDLLIYYRNYT